jgi:hypothetical protein
MVSMAFCVAASIVRAADSVNALKRFEYSNDEYGSATRSQTLDLLREQGKSDQVEHAEQELPDQVDPERHSGLLERPRDTIQTGSTTGLPLRLVAVCHGGGRYAGNVPEAPDRAARWRRGPLPNGSKTRAEQPGRAPPRSTPTHA